MGTRPHVIVVIKEVQQPSAAEFKIEKEHLLTRELNFLDPGLTNP
tara:strand:+ start:1346 stop:1480 length:135 start_codon:yes stop_codon:yes gene_type:complete